VITISLNQHKTETVTEDNNHRFYEHQKYIKIWSFSKEYLSQVPMHLPPPTQTLFFYIITDTSSAVLGKSKTHTFAKNQSRFYIILPN
jgi:hypothetical protein